MVKFRCPKCGQKLGVPDEWAGRRIRCNRCKEGCDVPSDTAVQAAGVAGAGVAQTPAKPQTKSPQRAAGVAAPADVTGEAAGSDDGFAADIFGKDLFPQNAEAGQEVQVAIPRPASSFKSPGPVRGESGPSAASAVLKGAGKIPLSLGASVVCTVVAAGLWAGIAAATGWSFFILEIGIGWAAGAGLVLFTQRRGVVLGLAAAAIGLFGIFVGKFFLAQWVFLPELRQGFSENGQLTAEMKENMTDEQIEEMLVDNPDLELAVVCRYLEDKGEIQSGFVARLVEDTFNGEENPQLMAELEELEPKIQETLEGWDDATRLNMVRKYLPGLYQQAMSRLAETPIGIGLALLSAFSLWDLVLIPLGLAAAFKMGYAEKD